MMAFLGCKTRCVFPCAPPSVWLYTLLLRHVIQISAGYRVCVRCYYHVADCCGKMRKLGEPCKGRPAQGDKAGVCRKVEMNRILRGVPPRPQAARSK